MKSTYLESTVGCSHPPCRQPGSSESCRLEDAKYPEPGRSCRMAAVHLLQPRHCLGGFQPGSTCLTGCTSEVCWWAGSCELHQRLFPPLSTLAEPRLSGSSSVGAFTCPGALFRPSPRYLTPHQLCRRSSGLQLSLGHSSS